MLFNFNLQKMISQQACFAVMRAESLKMLNLSLVKPHRRPHEWACNYGKMHMWVREWMGASCWLGVVFTSCSHSFAVCVCVLQPQPIRQQKHQGTAPWHIPLGISLPYCLGRLLLHWFFCFCFGLKQQFSIQPAIFRSQIQWYMFSKADVVITTVESSNSVL